MKRTLIVILALLFIAGCSYPFTTQRIPQSVDVRTGTQALSVSFVESAPPSQVKQSTQFPIYLDVRNVGAADIDRGFFRVLGNDPALLMIEPTYGSFSLKGRSSTNPIGDRTMVQLTGRSAGLAQQQQRVPAFFETEFCYPYKSVATVQVCIDTDYKGEKQEQKLCTPTTHSPGGVGGPVGITKITTHKALPRSPDKTDTVIPKFTISLRNLARGKVIASGQAAEYCSRWQPDIKTNQVNAEIRLSDIQLRCTQGTKEFTEQKENQGTVELKTQTSIELECELVDGIPVRAGTYLAPLQAILTYDYVEKVPNTLTITR